MEADKDGDGKISFEEFSDMVASTVFLSLPLIKSSGRRCQHDLGGSLGKALSLYGALISLYQRNMLSKKFICNSIRELQVCVGQEDLKLCTLH